MQEEKHTKLHEGERNSKINFTKNTKTTHKVEYNWSLNAEHNLQINATSLAYSGSNNVLSGEKVGLSVGRTEGIGFVCSA